MVAARACTVIFFSMGGVQSIFCVRRWGWAAGSTADDVLGVSTN